MADQGRWLQVEFSVAAADLAAAEEALLGLGAFSVSLSDPGGEPVLEPAPGATPLWARVIVSALLPAQVEEASVSAALGQALGSALPQLAFGALVERDWVREFRDNLHPLCFGERLWVCPAGTPCPDPRGASIVLDPGLAFGSGSHATTAMCLAWLASLELAGRSVLDWGCGSGILAIAALALGAGDATALDIDPQALQATADNARRNGRLDSLRIAHPAALSGERHDVVVANILADSLIGLAPVISRHCRSGACVALSGILESQAARVREGCAPWLDLHPADALNGWVLLAGHPVTGTTEP